jgi:hypothetical protein
MTPVKLAAAGVLIEARRTCCDVINDVFDVGN